MKCILRTDNFRYYMAIRDGICRGCGDDLKPKMNRVINTYSVRNGGQNILFCEKCVEEMYTLLQEGRLLEDGTNEGC